MKFNEYMIDSLLHLHKPHIQFYQFSLLVCSNCVNLKLKQQIIEYTEYKSSVQEIRR